ncbi:hypothetical protein ACVJGD_008633 [Bradyrhizobium sp. USDA 10063]
MIFSTTGSLRSRPELRARARGFIEELIAASSTLGPLQPAPDEIVDHTAPGRGALAAHFLIVDGALGLDKAIAAVWDGVPVQRCTVHKHRNLLAHTPSACMRRSLPTTAT